MLSVIYKCNATVAVNAMVVDTDPDPDVAAEWNSSAFYQYLMRQNEPEINTWLMNYVTGEEPSGHVGGLTKSDKARIVAELIAE